MTLHESPDDFREVVEAYRPPDGDLADAVLEYVTRHPDDPRWKAYVRNQLITRCDEAGRYLNMLTLFPGHGLFLEQVVLELTDDSSYHIRGWALEVLVCWAGDDRYWPGNSSAWVGYLRKRLADDCHDCLVREAIRESAQHLLARIGELPAGGGSCP